ncbi:DUF3426 domain-containing protein [Paraburkholderia diazotrophica]|uniref:DUF3426 domain-containing protein n=1 Tax=Paraburkholderia diazotrophica TaxID=667676 RepID=UPI001FE3688F|nr:DUF3426 domain-containing protein [Paraburkholderia diazotrophica]
MSIDDVTAYTLDKLANGGQAPAREGAAPAAEPAARADTDAHRVEQPAKDAGMHAAESASPHVAEATIEPTTAHPAETIGEHAAKPLASDEAARHEKAPAGHAAAQVHVAEAPLEAKDTTPEHGAASAGSPDFRAEAWNPWAPAPDASVDGRIRHNASTIPLKPVTIPSSAQPPLTLELTDSKSPSTEKATARKRVEPRVEAPAAPTAEVRAEPKVEPSVAAQAQPTTEPSTATQAQPKVEPSAATQAQPEVEPSTATQAQPKVEPSAATQAQPKVAQSAEPPAAPKTEPTFEASPERVLEQEIAEPPPHTWRAAEPARESAHAPNAETAGEAKAEADASLHEPLHEPLHETLHEGLYEPLRDKRHKPFFDPDDSAAAPAADDRRDREPHFGSPAEEQDYEPRFGGGARQPFAAAPDDDDNAFAVRREPLGQDSRRVVWQAVGGVAIAVLAVLLLAQLAWWQRESVMVAWPGSQSLFVKACANLGCKVGPPRDIDGLLVEPSDLRQIDGPHKLELRMPLRNRFDIALAYPAVELTLLDENNNVAVRRVLWPQDYVKPGTPIAAGLPARTTQTMIVRLDTGNTVASNFRVQIFYP